MDGSETPWIHIVVVLVCTTITGVNCCAVPAITKNSDWWFGEADNGAILHNNYTFLSIDLSNGGLPTATFSCALEEFGDIHGREHSIYQKTPFIFPQSTFCVGEFVGNTNYLFRIETPAKIGPVDINTCITELPTMPSYRMLIQEPLATSINQGSCPMPSGSYQFTYFLSPTEVNCASVDTSTAVVTQNTIQLNTCQMPPGGSTYMEPVQETLRCATTFPPGYLGPDTDGIAIFSRESNPGNFYCVRYKEDGGFVQLALDVSNDGALECLIAVDATQMGNITIPSIGGLPPRDRRFINFLLTPQDVATEASTAASEPGTTTAQPTPATTTAASVVTTTVGGGGSSAATLTVVVPTVPGDITTATDNTNSRITEICSLMENFDDIFQNPTQQEMDALELHLKPLLAGAMGISIARITDIVITNAQGAKIQIEIQPGGPTEKTTSAAVQSLRDAAAAGTLGLTNIRNQPLTIQSGSCSSSTQPTNQTVGCNSQPCKNNGTCQPVANGGYICVCPANFGGINCESSGIENNTLLIALLSAAAALIFLILVCLCVCSNSWRRPVQPPTVVCCDDRSWISADKTMIAWHPEYGSQMSCGR